MSNEEQPKAPLKGPPQQKQAPKKEPVKSHEPERKDPQGNADTPTMTIIDF